MSIYKALYMKKYQGMRVVSIVRNKVIRTTPSIRLMQFRKDE